MIAKVAVVYPFIPHYRRGVFSVLFNFSLLYAYVFFADDYAADNTIRSDRSGLDFETRLAPVIEWRGLVWQRGLFSVATSSEFGVLIFLGNPYYISTWFYALLARALGKRVFFWTHGWLSHDPFLKRVARNLFYRIPHGLLLYGERARRFGLHYGFGSDKLHVIYNSLNYPSQKRVRLHLDGLTDARNGLPEALRHLEMFAACIARLTPQCRFDLAIDALADLRDRDGLNMSLVLIGDGPVKLDLERYAFEKKVHVIFLGELYSEVEIGPVLYNARMVISPGKVGLTAMHGLAYGTPVVTHGDFDRQGPEFEAISEGVNGSFFTAGSVEDLVQKIRYWASRPRTLQERFDCYSVIEERYTPLRQLQLIEAAIGKGCS